MSRPDAISRDSGWAWFDTPHPADADADDRIDFARRVARVFASAEGEAVLAYLKGLTLERCLGPATGDPALRHLEGQRHLVLHLLALVARGRGEA